MGPREMAGSRGRGGDSRRTMTYGTCTESTRGAFVLQAVVIGPVGSPWPSPSYGSASRRRALYTTLDDPPLRRLALDTATDVLEQDPALEGSQGAADVRLPERDVAAPRLELDGSRDPAETELARLG